MAKHIDVLVIDDEDKFRDNLRRRLEARGFSVHEVPRGEDAIAQVRKYDYDVVLLDLKMPGLSGEETLREIRKVDTTSQVIVVTGHATLQSATVAGKLDAFSYVAKPVDMDELLGEIESARREKQTVLARHEELTEKRPSTWRRLLGTGSYRPLFLIIGVLLFTALVLAPTPQSMIDVVGQPKTGALGDPISGYADYRTMAEGQTIADRYAHYAKLVSAGDAFPAEAAALKLKVMVALLLLAAFFWATGAMPIGFTAILVGAVMVWFRVLPPELAAKAFVKDSVVFIFGVLALSVGIAKTGLDKRIGVLLLGLSGSLGRYLLIFLPLFAVTASFVSEHALVAFVAPLMVGVYVAATRIAKVEEDRALAATLLLTVTMVGNLGGPGSPSAGGRNAIMLGILKDYGEAPSYAQWMMYGMPFVPVAAVAVGLYFYLWSRKRVLVPAVNAAALVKEESRRLGPMLRSEYFMAAILLAVVVGWIAGSTTYGMGGPVLLGLVVMAVLRIVRWKDVSHIHWEVVFLYAGATALGQGLATTGAGLWVAKGFLEMLPEAASSGTGLAIAASLVTGLVTNLMSDGATVSAIGPITVPSAILSGTHPWMVGLATAFASSFAHVLVVGTPNNAIVYAVAVHPVTGKRLITLGDFAKHGLVVLLISFAVLWLWLFLMVWPRIGFPPVG